VINGLIDLIEEDTDGVVSYVMAQQPVASPTMIEQRKPYHEHAFGRSSGLVKNGGAWNAALAVEEGPIRRAGAILLVWRPLPNEAIRCVTVQLQGLQTTPDCDILLQDRHVESIFDVSNPTPITESIAHQSCSTSPGAHDRAQVGSQALYGRTVEPPVPPEQRAPSITEMGNG
jgi:hypothetical protein